METQLKRLSLILAVLAAPAYAENAPPEKPPAVTFGSGNPTAPYEAQHWTGVCEYLPDGRLLVHTAFLRNPQIAAEQCREWLEERK
jgi:hypothetical protein